LLLATIGVTVLLASGAALAITGGWADDGDKNDPQGDIEEPDPFTFPKYPEVGAMVAPGGFPVGDDTLYTYCTGTLISPTVFVTAWHCFPEPGDGVTFDDKYDPDDPSDPNDPSSEVYSICYGRTECAKKTDGEFIDHPILDLAVVVFDDPPLGDPPKLDYKGTPDDTTDDIAVTPAQLPRPHQFDRVEKGQKFTAVGYGDQATSFKETNTFLDQRMYAYSAFKSVNQTYLSLSQNQHQGNGGTCYGDSGGPNFLGKETSQQLGQPLTIASTTITGDTWCKATNVTLRLDTEEVQRFLRAELIQCSDKVDNDNDGKIDFGRDPVKNDPECTSATDDSESTL
jgi:V8-like Glu-specific endopeptidase